MMQIRYEILLLMAIAFGGCGGETIVAQSDSVVAGLKPDQDVDLKEVEALQEKLSLAIEKYEKYRLLAKRGSLSRSELSKARLDKRVAELELEIAKAPARKASNLVRIAQLKFESAEGEAITAERLYRRGSMSESSFQHKVYRRKLAEIDVRAAKGDISKDAAILLAGHCRVEHLKNELKRAETLQATGSVSKSKVNRLKQLLLDWETEVRRLEKLEGKKRDIIKDKVRT